MGTLSQGQKNRLIKIYRLHLKLSLRSLRNNNGDGYENIT